MNTFKKKSLYVALAGVSALGATGAAEAVNVNPDGLGQVLIYPYYTVRSTSGNAYTSLLSVVNSTNTAKAVKVRFLEGKNSREVLDFNLFLSKYDVWTAAILPTADGAMVATNDKSCTIPAIPAGGQAFVNYAYTGEFDDKGGSSLDRTREGYVEIIEMATFLPTSTTSINITHVNGVPKNCAAQTDTQAAADARVGIGGLFGGMSLLNVAAGTDYTEDAVALDNFNRVAPLYRNAGDIRPTLEDVFPPVSDVFGGTGTIHSDWSGFPIDAVSAAITHSAVLNEFVLDAGTRSGTDWVVTMPTKRYYVDVGTGSALTPFQSNFVNGVVGSCDDVSLNIYDREEQTTSTPTSFSPPPPSGRNQLCWEANVVTFSPQGASPTVSNVLGSVNFANITTSFQNGWLRLGFPALADGSHTLVSFNNTVVTSTGGVSSPPDATYFGLPVVGFAVQNFSNGLLSVGGVNVMSNYGGNFIHKYDPAVSLVQLLAQ